MKKILSIILIIMASAVLFAKTYTAYTEHFDIIYTDKSVKAADSIYKTCEQIYEEVSDLLGYSGNKHFPVYIDSDVEILNAFETQMPYNRIYLRDTTAQIGSITNYKDVLTGIFRHELTHAIQLEIKPGWFIKAGSAVFGDWFSFQTLQLFPSYVEGTAVMSESTNSEFGRLNDNATMQKLKQAKLENKFPSFFKAIGMRDIYPSGDLYYLFGGGFTEYLRKTYSEDKLRDFFNSTGRIQFNNITSFKFKKAFGLKQKLAWEDFETQVAVPDIVEQAETLYGKSRYTNLKYSNGKLYVIDTAKNKILTLEENKLASFDSVLSSENALSFGNDGSYLVLNNTLENTSMKLYNSKGKLIHTFKGYRGGTIAADAGSVFYALYRDNSQNTYVDIYNEEFKLIKTYYLGWGVYASDLCSPMDQVVAFIRNYQGKQNIVLINTATEKTAMLSNPDNIAITSLNVSPSTKNNIGILSFSWTTSGSSEALVRYGQLNITRTDNKLDVTQSLSYKDINGSIKYPVKTDNVVTYIGTFYDHDSICKTTVNALELSEPLELVLYPYEAPDYEQQFGKTEIPMRKYQMLKYFFDGSILPVPTESLSTGSFFEGKFSGSPVGLTYYTMDPSENNVFTASAGYFPVDKQHYYFIQTRNRIKNFTLSAQFEVQLPSVVSTGFFSFDWSKTLRHSNEKITLSNTIGEAGSGHFTKIGNMTILAYDSASLVYQNLHTTGKGLFDYSGFAFSFGVSKYFEIDRSYPCYSLAELQFHIPGFGPVLSHLKLSIAEAVRMLEPESLTAIAEVVPLCVEIQNGFKFIGLWFNRFVLDATYSGTYLFESKEYVQNVRALAYFTVSEAIGMVAKEPISIGARADWEIGTPLSEIKVTFYNSLAIDI